MYDGTPGPTACIRRKIPPGNQLNYLPLESPGQREPVNARRLIDRCKGSRVWPFNTRRSLYSVNHNNRTSAGRSEAAMHRPP